MLTISWLHINGKDRGRERNYVNRKGAEENVTFYKIRSILTFILCKKI